MKERLDKLLVDRKIVETREKAQALIMSGVVFVNNQKITKAGTKVPIDANIYIKEKMPYVSRGGFKLQKALQVFNLDVKDKICLDIGASTGGFTDCLLQYGAKKVYAVDVGTHQLHEKLRNDPRVISIEQFNAKYLSEKEIPEKIDIFVCDVSFISVLKIFPNICNLLKDEAKGVILIKPQFELSKEEVKGGVVKDKNLHIKAIKKVIEGLNESCYCVLDIDFSETWGPEGNIEFLSLVEKKKDSCKEIDMEKIIKVVEEAHKKKGEK
ncbi:TlyA family rRNA (cytidine-2'-O)-methyltransferase [Venenivibrio stagnispumantis]|uniref:23S rRNA (Cytidine1920-2'-O)/16S rRNA (Cytidine1409-2'-O)-methyltransferase n=1 Tax=Venenivibrio stagnispumantis TaxID=407998 RepID=A0AA45WMZ5_9AQUI|nr:TlyA family RNA methyltransferase [Venenivibrio stagnispumantis]MCW4573573.1 TlyA family RNA methyltransferase [Venenivibrio stagnispumantis]SMP16459.1 23S rRNA (cytidine1920-2'-O)/16S rRNA (cytidine1409-2'-O)-methyltransferase [Venenivibrio stagnispumantis]